EVFSGEINHSRLWPRLQGCGGDGLQKVCLAEADRGVEEQGIEADRARRRLSNRAGGRACHAIRCAFNEGLERVAAIERRAENAWATRHLDTRWRRVAADVDAGSAGSKSRRNRKSRLADRRWL